MSDILLDFVAILKLFTAGVMFFGGIFLAICYCCFFRDIDQIKLAPEYDKKTIDALNIEETQTSCEDGVDEEALPQKKSLENESFSVEDEIKGTNEQPKISV